MSLTTAQNLLVQSTCIELREIRTRIEILLGQVDDEADESELWSAMKKLSEILETLDRVREGFVV